MSKNIKGQSLNVNLNITEAGTFNADIFNAYNDFTLNGVSIVNRIVANEGDIAVLQTEMIDVEADIVDLENNKQDTLVIQQTITPSSTAVASADAIIAYVGSVTPSISATLPLVYSGSNISANFDNAPTNGSINFLNSDKIYDALALKQNNLVIQQSISPSSTAVASANAIISYVTGAVPNITATAPLVFSLGNISATFDSTPTFASNNFVSSSNIALALSGKQDTLVIQQTLAPAGATVVASSTAIVNALATKQDTITASTNLVLNDVYSASGTITGANIVSGTTNLLSAINANTAQITANTVAIGTKQDAITSTTLINCGDLNISGNTNATGYIYCNNDITSTTSIASPIVLQGTTNLLNEINTKQDIIDATTNVTTNNLDVTGALTVTGQATLNALIVNNAIVSTGTFVTSSGNIITQSGYIEATSGDITAGAGDITAINGNIRATNGNIVVDAGDITASLGDIVATTGTVQGATISGDLFSNLSAGGGITLTQNTPTTGVTQISANALSTSTQYAFKAYSTLGDAYSINGAVTIPYNSFAPQTGFDGYSIPTTSSYNTAQATYTVPVSGYWYFGYTLRQRTTATTNALVAIYRNSSIYMINGNYTGNGEGMSITLYADAGDLFYVRSISGSFSVDLRPNASMFFGFLLQPENNTIGVTTDLTLANLTASGNITGNIAGNLVAGDNISLSTTSNITTISSSPKILSLSLANNINTSTATGYTLLYDSVYFSSSGSPYNWTPSTGIITILTSGNYCISATGNIKNVSYNDRVNFRIRLRINGTWILGYPQAYSYARHQNYASYATSVISDFCLPLNAGDDIDIFCSVAKAQNSNFTSDFTGLQLFNGATFTIRTI